MVQCLDFPNLHFLGSNTGSQGDEDPRKHLDLWNGIYSYEFFFSMYWNYCHFLFYEIGMASILIICMFFFSFNMYVFLFFWNGFIVWPLESILSFLSFAMESFQRLNIEPWNWINLVSKEEYIPAPFYMNPIYDLGINLISRYPWHHSREKVGSWDPGSQSVFGPN